jgi:hypothetical protein
VLLLAWAALLLLALAPRLLAAWALLLQGP